MTPAFCCAVAALVAGVIDGDTIAVTAQAWPGIEAVANVRLIGIDTPELHGRCAAETHAAHAARDAVRALLPLGSAIVLTDLGTDKYGRILARVRLKDGRELAEALIAKGHGRPYFGGKRQGWCDE